MGSESFAKREREKKRRERSAAKRGKRETRAEVASQPTEPVDQSELMERFRVLSERHAVGSVTDEDYDLERRKIFNALGLDSNSHL